MVHKVLGKSCLPFFLSLLEVNDNLGREHFVGVEAGRPTLQLRRLIYRKLIYNQ